MSLTQRQKAERLVAELEKYFAKVHSDRQCPFGVSLTANSRGDDMYIDIAGCTVWWYDSMVGDSQFDIAPVLDRWVEQVVDWVDWTPRARQASLGGLLRLDPDAIELPSRKLPPVRQTQPADSADFSELNVVVPVRVPSYLDEVDVCGVLNKLISIGLTDAQESAEDTDLEDEARAEAFETTQLNFGEPFVFDFDLGGADA
ncbi:MAG: hypothetical protein B7Z37_25025 [Verrucomicrobia bacterium 12-59-8]|nr:MAG: hypothetical protein B7Z37_25025 [Verrucomicrobia bacterium 12-59-8]